MIIRKILIICVNIIFLVAVLTSFLTMYITFLDAYNNEDKQTLVSIDKYGEANFELIILTFFIPFVIIGTINMFRYMIKELVSNA